MSTKMSFTAAGDMLVQRRLPESYPGFSEIVAEIEKGDARFFNLETTLHNFESFGSQYHGGSYLCAPPAVLDDAKRFGFNMTSFANNHTLDWSYGGVEKTLEHLDASGLPHAGVGLDLQRAAAPAYLDLPQGRVALISTTSTFGAAAMAGNASGSVIGRPGVNGLRYRNMYMVTPDQAKVLKEISDTTHMSAFFEMAKSEGYIPDIPDNIFAFGEQLFMVGDRVATITKLNEADMARMERSIYEATLQADYILVSVHCHEMRDVEKTVQPKFLEEFARACIDFGAHAVIGHGPHAVRAVEIYKDCPIFYSLGDFVLQNENLRRQPADYFELYGLPADTSMHDLFKKRSNNFKRGLQTKREAFETFIPHWEMENGKLTGMSLLATELGYGMPRSRGGWPAPAADGAILEQVAELSAPYGTKFKIAGNRAELVLD